MPTPAGVPVEAFDFFDAVRIDVMPTAVDGTWRFMLRGNLGTTGERIERARQLKMPSGERRTP